MVALALVVAMPSSPTDTPLRKLFGLQRLHAVKPGEIRAVSSELWELDNLYLFF